MQNLAYYSFIAIQWLYDNIEILITNDRKSNLEKVILKNTMFECIHILEIHYKILLSSPNRT